MYVRPLAAAATACLSISILAAGASQAFAATGPGGSAPNNSLPAGAQSPGAHVFTPPHAVRMTPRATPDAGAFSAPDSSPFSAPDSAPDATVSVGCGPTAGADLQTAVDNAASGDTLVLSPLCDYSIDTPDPASTDSALYVNKTLTIDGNGATIQRDAGAAGDFRIIRIDDPGNLTLVHVTVKGGRATYSTTNGDGGGIEVNGAGAALTLRGSRVVENVAQEGGGGIADYGGTVTVTTSTLSGNQAGNGGGGLEEGAGTVTFSSSHITDNTADASLFGFSAVGGGAARMVGDGQLTINSSPITGNQALGGYTFGGAIENISGTVNLNSSPVSHNTASGDAARGGAVSNLGTLNVTSSPFRNNTANGTVSGGLGGGLSENGGPATFRSSPIMFNTASGPGAAGGGIYDEYGPVYLTSSPVLFNTPDNCSPTGSVPGCF
ncbi:hypothetical protein KGA66_24445 [Actinocrinis puniceicyclus]|uniref:Uncharacterized protein n=1 Tax=Actinocrinis puniceicyclus TaxID=977794 RepID=A0A8J8BDG4_9ACTN|nr:hypothetical protein [Actinocrinis puniceicyclus]MBS2966217.1 hypothetical protein [Actinocrinis puniceicyclus]